MVPCTSITNTSCLVLSIQSSYACLLSHLQQGASSARQERSNLAAKSPSECARACAHTHTECTFAHHTEQLQPIKIRFRLRSFPSRGGGRSSRKTPVPFLEFLKTKTIVPPLLRVGRTQSTICLKPTAYSNSSLATTQQCASIMYLTEPAHFQHSSVLRAGKRALQFQNLNFPSGDK